VVSKPGGSAPLILKSATENDPKIMSTIGLLFFAGYLTML
jgi:hypothetical protein